MASEHSPATRAITSGRAQQGSSLAPPLWGTSTWQSSGLDETRKRAVGTRADEFYSRYANPTVRAFEEGIRYDNPARFTRRRATMETDVDGVTLPEDAKLLLLHMPAGRDSRRWENPGTYDITREGVSLLSALARHVRSIELAGEPEVTTNMAVHGHEKLPLRIVPA